MNAVQTMEAVGKTARTPRGATDAHATMDSHSTVIREAAQVRYNPPRQLNMGLNNFFYFRYQRVYKRH